MKKLLNNKIFIFLLGCIITSGVTVLASTLNANEIKFIPKDNSWKVTNVQEAIDNLYIKETSHILNSYLVVNGQIGSISEFDLLGTGYTKFKYSGLVCNSSSDNITVTAIDNTFNNSVNLNENTEYEINDIHYRINLKKTNGNSWCHIKLTLYN